jgi:hypothetical protein
LVILYTPQISICDNTLTTTEGKLWRKSTGCRFQGWGGSIFLPRRQSIAIGMEYTEEEIMALNALF